MNDHGIAPIDLVVVNLYPFEEVRFSGGDYASVVENIDIGGPAMMRAAAKNHAYVAVVTDPDDYAAVLNALEMNFGSLSLEFRKKLAAKAFARTAAYDAAISRLVRRDAGGRASGLARLRRPARKRHALRREPAPGGRLLRDRRQAAGRRDRAAAAGQAALLQQHQRHRRRLRAGRRIRSAASAAVAIIKHANPCGVAIGETLKEAYEKALRCDPVSAFGGIVAVNRPLDAEAAEEIVKIFTEVIIAPDATPRGTGDHRGEEESAPAGRRRPARSARRRHDGEIGRRRPAGADRATMPWSTISTEGGDQARADARPRWPTCASPSASPSM